MNQSQNKLKLGDYLNSINWNKENLFDSEDYSREEIEKEYNSWVMNALLACHHDCLFYAQVMNEYSKTIPKKWQYDFYLHSLSKRKRFAPLEKAAKDSEEVKLIEQIYECSPAKAKEILKVLSPIQLDEIKNRLQIKCN